MAQSAKEYQAISDALRCVEPEFTSYLHCWDCCRCRSDLPLCCYSFLCPWCLWAELMKHLDQLPLCCCGKATWAKAYACIVLTNQLGGLLQLGYQSACPLTSAYSSCLCRATPFVSSSSRWALGRKYGISLNKDCINPFCAHYWCFRCAIYQEALYVKHILRKDFTCCFYNWLRYVCACFGQNPNPGQYCRERSPLNCAAVSPVIDAQPNCLDEPDKSSRETYRWLKGLKN